jgi:hypothetical protein
VSSSDTSLHALHSGPMVVLVLHMLGDITWCFFVLHFGCDLAWKFLGLFGASTCEKRFWLWIDSYLSWASFNFSFLQNSPFARVLQISWKWFLNLYSFGAFGWTKHLCWYRRKKDASGGQQQGRRGLSSRKQVGSIPVAALLQAQRRGVVRRVVGHGSGGGAAG